MKSPNKRNTAYLLRLWLPALLIGGLFAFIIVNGIATGQSMKLDLSAVFLVGVAGFVVIVLVVQRRRITGQAQKLLQQPTSAGFFAWYDKVLSRMPDADCQIAFGQGSTAAFYGEFEKTRRAYTSINWSEKAPLLQANGMLLQVLLDYLERKTFEDGHHRALKAKELASITRLAPGSAQSNQAFDLYVHIGDILLDNVTDQGVSALETAFDKSPILVKILAAWGLYWAYRKTGRPADSQRMADYLKAVAPHCKGLALASQ